MNSSMQRFLSSRGKMAHISNPLVPTPVTYADGTLGTEMLPAPKGSTANKTYNVGRNAEKRKAREVAKAKRASFVQSYVKVCARREALAGSAFGPAPRGYKPGVIGHVSN